MSAKGSPVCDEAALLRGLLSNRDGMRAVGIPGRGGRAASARIEGRGADRRLGWRDVRLPAAIAVAHRNAGRSCGRLGGRVVTLPAAVAVTHMDTRRKLAADHRAAVAVRIGNRDGM